MTRRGNANDLTEAYYIGLMNSVGYRNKDLAKPVIGIVNSWNDVNPGHKPFAQLAGVGGAEQGAVWLYRDDWGN